MAPHHTGPQETQQDHPQLSTTSTLSSEHRIPSSAPTPTLHGSMEPLHIPSSRSTWVPWAASSTFDSSHLPGLYPGKEICAPSVLRFHMPLAGFCHSPYPCAELREPRHRTSLFVRSPQCLLTPCSLIWSTSLFWNMEALLSQPVCSLSSLHECVPFHSPKGPEF